ncbi:hypothetical protein SCA6_000616 [Theobroma cacao]
MGILDGFPIPPDKEYLRDELSRIDESWAAARFDSLPHVVRILTSKDRDGEVQILKDQSDVVEDVVDEVVHAYHSGFNKAIQNYSQILRLFSESTESIGVLKVDLAEAKKRLGARNKQLHQLWYRSVTLRHIISLLDQIEGIAKVPARIEKLISEKQFYAAAQLQVQSSLMLEREGLQMVGALQDVRSELTKLRGVLFYKVLEDLHAHLYNKGEYSSVASSMNGKDDEVPTTTAVAFTANTSQPVSRRTRSVKGDSQFGSQGLVDGPYRPGSIDGGSSYDGHDEDGSLEPHDDNTLDGHAVRLNGGDGKDVKVISRQIPLWLLNSTPDEFVETIKKSDAPLHVKYLRTMVECLCLLHKVAAAGAVISQRLRPTIHEIITTKIKAHAESINSSRSGIDKATRTGTTSLLFMKGQLERYQLPKQKRQNGMSLAGTLLAVSPVSPVMAPTGKAQAATKELLDSILDAVSECQQLICEILRATPEAASADAAVQTARLASKVPTNEKRQATDMLTGLISFAKDGVGGVPMSCKKFTDRVASMLPRKYSQLGNDGLLAFVENFVKDHLLPTMFVDYRKGLLGWAQAMPKFSADLVKYVQTFLERTYERCRTSYMEAVLEKQSYMLIGRHDIEKLMRLDPASACLPNALGQSNVRNIASDAESIEVESELSELLLNLRPIKQITRRDEEMAPFVAGVKRNYIFGGICSIATNASIKALAAIPSIDSEAVRQRLDHALLAFITEHEHLFTAAEYANLLKVQVPGREIPPDAQDRFL